MQQISVGRASQAFRDQPSGEGQKDSFWVWRMAGVLNRYGGVWLSVPDAELGDLLKSVAVETLYPDWMPSREHEEPVRQAYRRLEEVAALLEEPQQPSSCS